MSTEFLHELVNDYAAEVTALIAVSRPTDGLFGIGSGPKNDPCHVRFYETMRQAVAEGDAYENIRFLLRASQECSVPELCRPMLEAIHGLAEPLAEKLTAEQCRELMAWYDENVPKRRRLPVQRSLYKALRRGAGGNA